MNNPKRLGSGVGSGLFAALLWTLAAPAIATAQPAPAAQPRPAQPAAAQPAPAAPPAAQPAAAQPAPASPLPAAQPVADVAKPTLPASKDDPIAKALAKEPDGLSLDEVAKLALKTKPSIRAKQADLKAAAAKVDQALVGYFPRVTISGGYTRLSEITNTLGGGGSFLVVGADAKGNTLKGPVQSVAPGIPCPSPLTGSCVAVTDKNNTTSLLAATALNIPTVLDTFSFTATLAVPVSDYLLRISQGHAAAQHNEKSKQIELDALTLTEAADAKVAYLNWVRAKGQVVVAKEAVAQANAHVEDVKRLKLVGLASQADVLRVEAQVASADQVEVQLEAFSEIAEEQVRIALGLPKDKPLKVGIDVFNVSPPASLPQLKDAQDQALQKRLEIRALDETELSLKETENVVRAGLYPRLDAFADLNVGNPNPRYPFAGAVTNTTWDAGVRASWTFNDTFTTIGAAAESKARVTQVAESKNQLRDGLRLEVTAAWTEIKKSAATIDAATRGLTASEESLRVRRELFLQGKATNVEMLDAETEVTRARLLKLDAQIGLIVNQIKYDHAIGNDVSTVRPATSDAKDDKGDDASAKKPTEDASAKKPAEDASAQKPTNVASAAPAPILPLK